MEALGGSLVYAHSQLNHNKLSGMEETASVRYVPNPIKTPNAREVIVIFRINHNLLVRAVELDRSLG